jgi:hypothetical protein
MHHARRSLCARHYFFGEKNKCEIVLTGSTNSRGPMTGTQPKSSYFSPSYYYLCVRR